jgi:hypothetical protein
VFVGPANPFAAGQAVRPRSRVKDTNPSYKTTSWCRSIRRSSISTVAFAFAVAALITDRVDKGWPIEKRRWALFAWGFLTIGILLGGWWS